ncbi:MAG: hypothetical protein N2653_14150, partial [Burkholderiales bacterium]|nr:hypothetical protein [Burkholderiales bacterium]
LRAVLLDAAGDAAAALALTWRWELLDLLRGEREYAEVALPAPGGVRIVPAARGVAALAESGEGGARLFEAFANLSSRPDLLVFNTPARESAACALVPAEAEVLLVTTASAEAVKATYARLKALVRRHGRRSARLFVNRAEPERARELHAHMAAVARRFLGVELLWGGVLGAAPELASLGAAAAAGPAHARFAALATSLDDWRLAEFGAPRAAASP